jgi:rod shape-determining protein MreC
MRNLLNFILRHYFFFLFVALQVVAFALIFQNHFYQRSAFVNSSNYLAGNAYGVQNNISQYFNLRKINEQLALENTSILEKSPGSFLMTDQQIFTFNDTVYKKQFSYINARVINNSIKNRNNYITLNKGRMHGIKPDMGIITSNGVIGIVKVVSDNFSSVISFLHSDIQVSAKIAKNDHLGTVLWEGYNYRKASMLYIPPHVELSVGDSIITSGFSKIFPEGILIGTISDFEIRRGDNFFTIGIDLATDFNNLNYVSVVRNIYSTELQQLEAAAKQ